MPNQRAPGVTPRTVAFPDELWERAQKVAADLSMSTSELVRQGTEQVVEQEESEPFCRRSGVE